MICLPLWRRLRERGRQMRRRRGNTCKFSTCINLTSYFNRANRARANQQQRQGHLSQNPHQGTRSIGHVGLLSITPQYFRRKSKCQPLGATINWKTSGGFCHHAEAPRECGLLTLPFLLIPRSLGVYHEHICPVLQDGS